ncbi:hypothetical protein [Actinomadura oligospora]|uniref:hypothetical protein n=1 Tax=Actinomadura oligospora TaxID=111804 RepID=UPI00047D7DB2|nr:hypothetical protein [Actinomadura oligospora]
MIIPLRDAHGIPDVSRLADWTASCDACPVTITLAHIGPWFVSRDDATLCPSCWHAESDRLIHLALRPGGPQGALADLHYLSARAKRLARRLLTRFRHHLADRLPGKHPRRLRPAA